MEIEQKKLLKQLSQMGDVVVIRKDGSRLLLNDEGNIPLKTQADAVLYFLERLDSDMLKLILDEKQLYQEYDKQTFIKKLAYAFEEFSKRGNTFLNRFEGNCTSGVCTNTNCKGFSFVGNKSNDYFDLIIESQDGVVLDIYECLSFKCENQDIQKSEYIGLDKSDYPF